jgi:hypothetical protein
LRTGFSEGLDGFRPLIDHWRQWIIRPEGDAKAASQRCRREPVISYS